MLQTFVHVIYTLHVNKEDLSQGKTFVPIAIESHGTFSKSALGITQTGIPCKISYVRH